MPLPKRKPMRLKGYDYSADGYYFVTTCAKDKRCLFSTIRPAVPHTPSGMHPVGRGILDAPPVELSEYGKVVESALLFLHTHSKRVRVHRYVIMPNHVHLLLQVLPGASGKPRPTNEEIPKFMSSLKRYSNRVTGQDLWQDTYYDHIIRDEEDYLRVWEYIETNPGKWREDTYFVSS